MTGGEITRYDRERMSKATRGAAPMWRRGATIGGYSSRHGKDMSSDEGIWSQEEGTRPKLT
ncbi:MAG: hypothetical protein PHI12_10975 [Dehalococcoidales bacterium]|nr:hypothetical protein [Dehalococcoidales bacterium]